MIQLIRRDGQVIELQAETINFSVTRGVAVWALPIFGVRAGLDLNQNLFSITVQGIMTDDRTVSGSAGASATLDISRATTLATSWFAQQRAIGHNTIALIKTYLHGKQIVLQSAGQKAAGLGETIVLQFVSTGNVPSDTTATKSILPVNLTGTVTNTGHIAAAIFARLGTGNVNVAGASTAMTSVFTRAYKPLSGSAISATDQGLQSAQVGSEAIVITNLVKGTTGNTYTTLTAAAGSGSLDFLDPFFVSNFTGGVTGSRKSKGDKIQDLIDMTVNASAGGGMLSPQSFTGDLIEMPDSIASFDVASLLRIQESPNVKKYIVGIRIPYESMVTASGVTEELRQFIVPSGPGTSMSSEENTQVFDPIDTTNGESIRPNPFFRQGIAIPGIVQTFEPAFAAGDSVWTYTLGFNACEQLIGI